MTTRDRRPDCPEKQALATQTALLAIDDSWRAFEDDDGRSRRVDRRR